jgi:hypothetical protein
MQVDLNFDPIRDDPEFARIMKAGHPERRYASVWAGEPIFDVVPVLSVDPNSQYQKCQELAAKGYRPTSWAVTRIQSNGGLLAASVWYGPFLKEQDKDLLAERQATAAVTLIRLGESASIWPLLRHSADPRLRSFIIDWLKPSGVDPGVIALELENIKAKAKGANADTEVRMEDFLMHPETSMRRALILALGTYGSSLTVARRFLT